MTPQHTARVARWLGCLSVGLLGGAVLQTAAGFKGAGPATMLGTVALIVLGIGLSAWVGAPSSRWRIGLLFGPVALHQFGTIEAVMTAATHRILGATTETWILSAVVLAAALWPAARLVTNSIAPSPGPAGPLMFALGLFASAALPSPTWSATLAAVLLALSATSPNHQRPSAAQSSIDWPGALLAFGAGIWLSSGWVHLRTVFDPSVTGILAVGAGAALGSIFSRSLSGLLWTGLVGGVLWAVPHGLEWAAPQLGALALSAGKTGWLSLPLFGLGVIAGPLCRFGGTARTPTLGALSLGIWTGPWLATQSHTPWIAVAVLVLSALFAASSGARVIGGLAAAAIVLVDGWRAEPDSVLSRTAVWAHASQPQHLANWLSPGRDQTLMQHGLTDAGAFITWKSDLEDGEVGVTIDGLRTSSQGRQAAAEELAGHLGVLLGPMREPMVILGDWAGNALRGVAAHPDGLTHVAAPLPHVVRSLAAADGVRERLWLQPTHPLYPEHPARLMSRMPDVPVVVDIVHSPWTDGANWGLDEQHIETVSQRLGQDGVYVLCLHTRFFDDGQLSAVASGLSRTFSHAQLWLAPEGVDSAIFVASDAPITLNRIRARFNHARTALEALGFPTAESLAGAALLGTEGVKAWGDLSTTELNATQMSRAILERPTLHLAAVTGLTSEHPSPWDTEDSDAIAMVRSARLTWLDMLEQASTGNLEAAFSAARALGTQHGDIGASAIDALITPHIEDGQAALIAAAAGAPGNTAWDDALRFATTARMLAPKHHLPLTLLGDISLAQGRLPKALEDYQAALTAKPDHIPALEGVARWARLSQSPKQAEQALRTTTRHAPRDWRTWHNLGVFLLEQGRIEEASKAVDAAVGLAPSDEAAPSIVLTTILLDENQAGAALLRADALTKSHPDNGLSWFLRGRAHYALNRMGEAEEDFRKAVLTDSDLIEARSGIGLVRAVLGDIESAATVFRDVLQRDPGNAAARENLRRLGEAAQ